MKTIASSLLVLLLGEILTRPFQVSKRALHLAVGKNLCKPGTPQLSVRPDEFADRREAFFTHCLVPLKGRVADEERVEKAVRRAGDITRACRAAGNRASRASNTGRVRTAWVVRASSTVMP